jgi:DNA-binding transcriptional regulator YdaS (Cro superfamily)
MKVTEAIELAGGRRELAELLGISLQAVCQWRDALPQARVWQLQILRPEWFKRRKP